MGFEGFSVASVPICKVYLGKFPVLVEEVASENCLVFVDKIV